MKFLSNIIIINGIYDILCVISILKIVNIPVIKDLHLSMLKENENLTGKYNEIMNQRRGDGNPNSYLPQPMNPSSSYVKNEVFNRGSQNNDKYEGQFKDGKLHGYGRWFNSHG
jgi:hypothetical protein